MFMERFATAEGRIVDTGNAGVSHTEGQGIGLLSTAMFGEEMQFIRLLEWTERTLKRSGDSLHAWRFQPSGVPTVPDSNAATDGELLIAHALFLGGARWGRPGYITRAQAIARDVRTHLVGEAQGRQVLLPGLNGGRNQGMVEVNPSYYLFPVLQNLAVRTGDASWMQIHDDGIAMLRDARFGRWGLPADWINVPRGGGPCMIAPYRPARFSYDAIRLPFYLAWAGIGDHPILRSAVAFWGNGVESPAWVDLRSNAMAPYAMTSGMRAIRDYVRARVGITTTMMIPSVKIAPTYYDAALTMLVRVALANTNDPSTQPVA